MGLFLTWWNNKAGVVEKFAFVALEPNLGRNQVTPNPKATLQKKYRLSL
jgi:hypothetical protein